MSLTAPQIETLVDTGASTCLGGAAAFAAFAGLAPWLGQSPAIAGSAAVAGLAYWFGRRALSTVNPNQRRSSPSEQDDELGLPDRVSEARPSAEVVQLFDPASTNPAWAGPADVFPSAVSPDASQALHDALNRLRRSLR